MVPQLYHNTRKRLIYRKFQTWPQFNGIHTLYELLSYKERELSDMKKIGIDRASEINSYLVKLGLRLGMVGEEG